MPFTTRTKLTQIVIVLVSETFNFEEDRIFVNKPFYEIFGPRVSNLRLARLTTRLKGELNANYTGPEIRKKHCVNDVVNLLLPFVAQ